MLIADSVHKKLMFLNAHYLCIGNYYENLKIIVKTHSHKDDWIYSLDHSKLRIVV